MTSDHAPLRHEPEVGAGAKADAPALNRAQKRAIAKSLAREFRRVKLGDMAKTLRAKRTAKRREAAKVKNLNRRRA